MTTDGQRTARAALDAARAAFEELDRAGAMTPDDVAARLVEAWQGTEGALQAFAGTSVLSGVAVVRELRQRSHLSLDDAHALVDFHAAAERAATMGYAPTAADVAAAFAGRDHLMRALGRDPAVASSHPYSGPISSGAAPRPEATAPRAPTPTRPVEVPAPHRTNALALGLVLLAVLAVVGAGVFYASRIDREPEELRAGRAAYAAGDRMRAKNAFSAAYGADPTSAEPLIYLGRMAREEGNLGQASEYLRRAVETEPDNALAQRELAAYLLATGQLDLARSFYERAIRLDPDDRNALGFMGCTLHRMGRPDLAQRFAQRAGRGSWDRCLQLPPPPVFAPAPGAPAPLPRQP